MSNQTYNFQGVEEAGLSMTSPGTIDAFEIKELKFGLSSQKATPEVEVTFVQDKGTSSFRKKFFFSEKAITSFQHLVVKATGSKFTEPNMTEEQMVLKLKGKRVGLKVLGRKADNGQGYPDIAFGGFACTIAELPAFKASGFTDLEKAAIKDAIDAQLASRSAGNADSSGSGAPTEGQSSSSAGDKKEDDPF